METLANILAGVPANPMQVSPGISPLLMQQIIAQQGQQPGLSQANIMSATQPQGSAFGNTPSGFGALNTNALLPLLAAGP